MKNQIAGLFIQSWRHVVYQKDLLMLEQGSGNRYQLSDIRSETHIQGSLLLI